ncbi:hypothetical protein M153_11200016622 [Pseudoloma neurophilia]|uniref:Uncharacterized protein n=1 Tax=Pseudoloma neurophilia TaxID=146866 RepID=A0A0R0M739_9MICR|nr:hypothetical protein M153_11200016622 [Pseudoloma neurophilia]
MFLLFAFLMQILSSYIELIPVLPGTVDINTVCRSRCRQCVFATPENIPYLVCLLRKERIREAAVCGWNDCPGNFIVDDCGRIRCYGPDTLGIEYVFCKRFGYPPRCNPYCYRPKCPIICPPCGPYYSSQNSDNDPPLFGSGYLLSPSEQDLGSC